MDWHNYEAITKYIYETLGKEHGVKIEGYGKDCRVVGKSSVEHQIDVLTSHSDGIHFYRTMIECKYWDQHINKDIIMKVSEIVEDAALNKGIIVSKNGFTPDAITYAKYRNIGLVELRKPTEEDWKGRLRNITFEMHMLLPTITGFQFIITPETTPLPYLEKGHVPVELFSIKSPDGIKKPLEHFLKDFNSELSKKQEGGALEQEIMLDEGSTVIYTPNDDEMPIKGLKINGILKIAKQTVEIKGDDHIFMIMKSIFENKSYSITKDLEITERDIAN